MDRHDMATLVAASRPREPAETHFRKLGDIDRVSEDRSCERAVFPPSGVAEQTPGKFEIYREDEIRMTSTRFCGGDWHWCLSDADGLILLDTGGYPSEHACRQAVAILKERAAFASFSPTG